MLNIGTKIKHCKSPNFIAEMADQFNVVGTGGDNPGSHRIILIVGRNEIDITEETLIEVAPGKIQAQALADAVVLSKTIFANITMTLESAEALVAALQQGINQARQMPNAEQ